MAKLLQTSAARPKGPLYKMLKKLVLEMREHQQAWPFLEPVSGVPDYYNIIKNPMGRLLSCCLLAGEGVAPGSA
jgi:hypothetical protein